MAARIHWSRVKDETLLRIRFRDLPLNIEGTPLKRYVRQLHRELKSRGIRFLPHVWLSDEFFTPDNVPGFAIPFYLANPRLMKLERRQMLTVEGGSEQELMRILRHEAAHALDNAYKIHTMRGWRETFGSLRRPYPESYKPNPASRNFVLNLSAWYAQAHPLEDFAETFAVWLRPNSRWRNRYKGWPALKKLEYVDELMQTIAGKPAKNWHRAKVDTIRELGMTLGEYYQKKKEQYSFELPAYFDRDLLRIFTQDPRYASNPTAASFLRSYRSEIRRLVSEGTNVHAYTVDHVLNTILERVKELKLRTFMKKPQTRLQFIILLTVHTMNIVHSGRYRFYYGL